MLGNGGADDFTSTPTIGRAAREAGKSMNPPMSRGGNLRNG